MPRRPVSATILTALIALAAAPAAQTPDSHASHSTQAATQAPAPVQASAPSPAPANESLPPDAERAKAALEKSPRHGEWVDIAVPGGAVPLRSWVVYPERKDKAGVVIVIHEIFGLSDWIRSVADQLAEDGFIAVAPDLISGKGPGNGGTDSVTSSDDVVKLVRGLTPDEVVTKLDAVRNWTLKIPATNRKTATIGFCWGGASSFAYATRQPALDAAVVYYGTSPSEPASLVAVKAPVLGLYAGDDARVNTTIEPAAAEMKKAGRAYEVHVYDGAGHGFLRQQTGRDGANMKATEQAWPVTIAFLRKYLQ